MAIEKRTPSQRLDALEQAVKEQGEWLSTILSSLTRRVDGKLKSGVRGGKLPHFRVDIFAPMTKQRSEQAVEGLQKLSELTGYKQSTLSTKLSLNKGSWATPMSPEGVIYKIERVEDA